MFFFILIPFMAKILLLLCGSCCLLWVITGISTMFLFLGVVAVAVAVFCLFLFSFLFYFCFFVVVFAGFVVRCLFYLLSHLLSLLHLLSLVLIYEIRN